MDAFTALSKSAKLVKAERQLYKEAKIIREQCVKELDALHKDMITRSHNYNLGIDGVLNKYHKTTKKEAYRKTYSRLKKAKKELGEEYAKEKARLENAIKDANKVKSASELYLGRLKEDLSNWKNYSIEFGYSTLNGVTSIFLKRTVSDFTPSPQYNNIANKMKNGAFNDLNQIEYNYGQQFRRNAPSTSYGGYCRLCNPCELGPQCTHGPCSRCTNRMTQRSEVDGMLNNKNKITSIGLSDKGKEVWNKIKDCAGKAYDYVIGLFRKSGQKEKVN